MERIAKLAIQRDLPENFKCAFETVYDARFNSFWDEESPGSYHFYDFYYFRNFFYLKIMIRTKHKGHDKRTFESIIGPIGLDK